MSFAITGTVLTVGSTVYAARQAGNASHAQQQGADAATAETARQYDQTRADLSSGRSLYEGANSLLGQLYGIPVQSSQQFQQENIGGGIGELFGSQGGVPTVNAQRYASDPAYRYAWDTTLAAERASPAWRNRGASTYYARGTDADFGRLNEELTRNLTDYRTQHPTTQAGGGSAWRPTGSGGVEPNTQILPSAGGGSAPGGTPGAGNMAGFFASPDYNFRRSEGTRDIQGTFAARGGAQSGNALRALAEFNSNLAAGEYGNYFNRLTTLAGLGSAATSQTAAYGANAASQAGRNALISGDARASGITDRANVIGQGVNQLGGLWGYLSNRNQPQNMTWGAIDQAMPWAVK